MRASSASASTLSALQVEVHIHGRPRVGEACSGDAGAARTIAGVTWVLLVDGLGHGDAAHEVASRALDEHARFDAELSIDAAFRRLHDRLVGSRGAAATLLRFGERSVGFTGIGNIVMRTLAGRSLPYVATAGILGKPPLRLRSGQVELASAGRLVLFTDGVARTAPMHALVGLDPDALCRKLIAEHSVERDDATVVHVDYRP
ncbi:phosphoserine phosphatase [Nannocystaceae bacterium ST9]